MEAKHESGSILPVRPALERDLRTLHLLVDCGYTHVRRPTWGWEPITAAVARAR